MRRQGLVVALGCCWAFLLIASCPGSAQGQWRTSVAQPREVVNIANRFEVPSGTLQYAPQLIDSVSTVGVPAMRSAYPFVDGRGQSVVVIDTGIDYTHSALSGRYVTGWDFADNDSDPMDYEGHGTHVSGVIASTDATYGGVAPGAGVISLKVFPDAGGSAGEDAVNAALNWVISNKATYNITAVNMSLGDGGLWTESEITGSETWEPALASLRDMGVFVACSAGDNGFLGGVNYPAASPNTVSVGGTWASSNWSDYMYTWEDPYTYTGFEFYDAEMADNGPLADDIMVTSNRYMTETDGQLDLLAPAGIITSSIPLSLDTLDGTQDGWEANMGTSMSAAHVTGAAMLVRQALQLTGTLDPNPEDQVDQILTILQSTGTPLIDDHWAITRGANNCNVVRFPDYSDDIYYRPSTDATFSRIDLDAAIASIDPLPPAVPGDTDGDGDVDQADAAIMAGNWGEQMAGGSIVGDFNGDGWVNMLDASILAANWTGSQPEQAAVPEPGVAALLVAGLMAWALRGRRR